MFDFIGEVEKMAVAETAGISIENIRGPFSISFQRLENGTDAHIDEHRRIFFPQNFSPISGQVYRAYYVQTLTGIYVFRGVQHRVCRVYLADKNARTVDSYKEPQPKGDSPFAIALQGFKAPPCVERHTVRAQRNPKSDEIGFAPIYKDADPDFDNRPTMYFLHAPKDSVLVVGKEYRVKVESKKSTRRENRQGALMIDVQVSID